MTGPEGSWQQPGAGAGEWFGESPFRSEDLETTASSWEREPGAWESGAWESLSGADESLAQGVEDRFDERFTGAPAAEWERAAVEQLDPPWATETVALEHTGGAGPGAAERQVPWTGAWEQLTGDGVQTEVPGCGTAPPPGVRPLIHRSTLASLARVPAVGYAQHLLNRFLDGWRAGTECGAAGEPTKQYIRSLHAQLRARRQDPLGLDCSFGEGTELATKMFQACRGLVRDGKIGERTWNELEKLGDTHPPTPPPPPPTPPQTSDVLVRADVWTLSAAAEWHPTILWYARAIAGLQARDGTTGADPRSWRHLAETHGSAIQRNQWPLGAQWDSCQHNSWHFLPWHRVYLHHFERIVRDEVVRLGGPRDWALPYWNYSDASRPDVRRLPPAFRRPQLPGNAGSNPLYVRERDARINGGAQMREGAVDATAAFRETIFSPAFAGGFGGRSAPAGTHAGTGPGALELTPHGAVHMAVGGTDPDGFMSDFATAGRDPIFWLHHANVDRLWEAWLRRAPNANPPASAWLSARWVFGSAGTVTSLTTAQVLDPRQPPLGYRYSDMPAQPVREAVEERFDADREVVPELERPPELVGSSAGPVPVGSRVVTAKVDVSAPSGPVAKLIGESGTPPDGARVFLRMENITARKLGAGAVEVHLNVPEGASPRDFRDRRVGEVPMFGVKEASRRSDAHSGSGLTVTLEITQVVRALAAASQWDPATMRVTFTPVPDASGRVPEGDVVVGRVSLFYA